MTTNRLKLRSSWRKSSCLMGNCFAPWVLEFKPIWLMEFTIYQVRYHQFRKKIRKKVEMPQNSFFLEKECLWRNIIHFKKSALIMWLIYIVKSSSYILKEDYCFKKDVLWTYWNDLLHDKLIFGKHYSFCRPDLTSLSVKPI